MTARLNGQVRSQGNFKDIYLFVWEMIARLGGFRLYPGDARLERWRGLLELTR
jgi:2-keto-4-pentenoate hydratase/2-oxohepta-3-ene-1,7-dioic acid hydratase in catechol pathway